jgi:hypothetical protein
MAQRRNFRPKQLWSAGWEALGFHGGGIKIHCKHSGPIGILVMPREEMGVQKNRSAAPAAGRRSTVLPFRDTGAAEPVRDPQNAPRCGLARRASGNGPLAHFC